MKAVILTAGKGTRMLPFSQTHEKAMLPVGGEPFLSHIIYNLKKAGITDLMIVTNSTHNSIHKYFGDGAEFGVSINYVTQYDQLGTAHAIRMTHPHFTEEDERFLVLSGDTIVSANELELMLMKKASTVIGTMIVEKDQQEYGVIECDEQYVSKIVEKPEFSQSYMVNAGVYIFDSTIFESIAHTNKSVRNEFEITDSIQQLINKGEKVRYIVFQDVSHISRPWDLLDYNMKYLSDLPDHQLIQGTLDPSVQIKGLAIIEKGARVYGTTYIEGPVIIGKNSTIGPNSYIRPYTCIGENVRIGSSVEIKSSIIMDWTHVGHFTYIGDSIIGVNCNFGAGTQVANLRLDNEDIRVQMRDLVINSNRRKLGTMMGDNVHTGINSMLNSGSVIEAGTNILPGEFVSSYKSKGSNKRQGD